MSIHKMIGYGLVDVKTKKDALADSRFNPKGIMFNLDDPKWTLEGYADWLLARAAKIAATMENNRDAKWRHQEHIAEAKTVERFVEANRHLPYSIHPFFKFDAECGLDNVWCVVPVGYCKEWFRYDDTIDYHEETWCKGRTRQGNRVKVMEHGIFPFNCEWCDSRTGRRLDGDLSRFFRSMAKKKDTSPSALRGMAVDMGFKNRSEAIKYSKPLVPFCIEALCEYTEVFKDPKTIHQLNPMLYVYWP